jgi:hypothetical protein
MIFYKLQKRSRILKIERFINLFGGKKRLEKINYILLPCDYRYFLMLSPA